MADVRQGNGLHDRRARVGGRKIRAAEIALAMLSAGCFAAFFTYPLLLQLSTTGIPTNDWDLHLEGAFAAWRSIVHFRQVPHWDPYKCGGLPLLADPQVRILTPFFLLHLIFGPVVGLHLEAILHVAAGWAGGYFLGRQIGLGLVPSIVCASLFPSSSWMYLHLAEGNGVFMALEYLPWILALWLRATDTGRVLPIAIGGLVCAIAFVESGVYVVYLTVPLLFAIAAVLAFQRRSIRPLVTLVAMTAFSAGFGAIKLIPVLALGISRPTESPEVCTPWMLAQQLFSRDQDHNRVLIGMVWGFHEYGAYVEPFFAVLAVLGAVRFPKRSTPWLAGALIALALSVGSPMWWAPWALLHRLPFYNEEHVPSRFLIPFVMALSPLAGLGTEAVVSRRSSGLRMAVLIVLGAALVDAMLVSKVNLQIALMGPPTEVATSPQFRQFRTQRELQMYSIARSNQGALSCYANNQLGFHAMAYNDPGYRGEYYLTSSGSVALVGWSPNRLAYDVDLPAPSKLVVNQNFDEGWSIMDGHGRLFGRNGLIAIELPAGKQRLRLIYRTRGLRPGLAVALLTLMVAIGLVLVEKHRRHGFP